MNRIDPIPHEGWTKKSNVQYFIVFAANSGEGGLVDGKHAWHFEVLEDEATRFVNDMEGDPEWGRIFNITDSV